MFWEESILNSSDYLSSSAQVVMKAQHQNRFFSARCIHPFPGQYFKALSLVLILLFVGPFVKSRAQQDMDYAIHANIIYHFTKYVDWPDDKKSGDFVIGVLGDSPVYDELQRIVHNKSAGGQRIIIRRLPGSDDAGDCHIVFIDEEETGSLKKIVSKTTGLPVLLVCEEEGMALKGACIDFALSGERLKLEINKNIIEMRHLHVATELLQLGSIVK
jgi:hypothetical protein